MRFKQIAIKIIYNVWDNWKFEHLLNIKEILLIFKEVITSYGFAF